MIRFCVVTETGDPSELRKSIECSLSPEEYEFVTVNGKEYDLFTGYNKAAEGAQDALVFVHDDLVINSNRQGILGFASLTRAPKVGVVGVAGAVKFPPNGVWWNDRQSLSGAAGHTKDGNTWVVSYGPYGRVSVVDGLIMAIHSKVFNKIGGFPKCLSGYDFYDLSLCSEALMAGYNNYTYPLFVTHKSMGDVSDRPSWHVNREKFLSIYSTLAR